LNKKRDIVDPIEGRKKKKNGHERCEKHSPMTAWKAYKSEARGGGVPRVYEKANLREN